MVLGYVEQHKAKSGTPTMGGIIFIVPIVVSTLIFGYSEMNLVAVMTTVAYAVLGFWTTLSRFASSRIWGFAPTKNLSDNSASRCSLRCTPTKIRLSEAK